MEKVREGTIKTFEGTDIVIETLKDLITKIKQADMYTKKPVKDKDKNIYISSLLKAVDLIEGSRTS